jgi:hypothetical protein
LGLSRDPVTSIKDADFIYANSKIRVVANRDSPAIELPGLLVGPFKEGKEYEVQYWVAQELKKSGIIHVRSDETFDLMGLNRIHWKESVQTFQKLTSIPVDFYPKLRRFLQELRLLAIKRPEKRSDYEKAKRMGEDIATMRLKKIVSLASSTRSQTSNILQTLTKEERVVYDLLNKIVNDWRKEILRNEGEEES